jgi:hypothetical protein
MQLMNSKGIRASEFFRKHASATSRLWAGVLIAGSLAGIAAAQPVNDHFANRTLIPSLPATVNGDTTGSTLEAGDPMTGRSIWWKFTPQVSGSHYISAYPAYANAYRLHLYSGNSLGTLVKQEGQRITSAPTYTWLEKFELTAGVEYSILVGSMVDWVVGPVTLKVNRNSPPVVAVTHPTAGKPYYHGTNVELRVNASDADGNVARVDYYLGPHYYEGSSQPVASSTVAPFSATITLPTGDAYQERVFAVATDDQGAKTVSASVSFLVTQYVAPPANDHFADRILIPALPATVSGNSGGSTYEDGEPVAGRSIWWKFVPQASGSHYISAYPGGSINHRFQLYTGNSLGALVKQTGQLINGSPAGTRMEKFELSAGVEYSVRIGSQGSLDDDPVTLTIAWNSPPVVSITHPTAGKPYYNGTNLELRVNASDPDGNVARVDYYFGHHYNEGSSQPVASSTVSPFSATTTLPPAGTYQENVFAVATDNQGAKTVSASVSFLITEYVAPPANDHFADRILIPALPATVSGNNDGSTYEEGEPVAARSIWWKFIPQTSGSHYISAYPNGSTIGRIRLYTGNSLGTLVNLTGQLINGSPEGTRMEKFELSAGVEYSVRIGSQGSLGDDPVTLTVSRNAPPSISIANPVDGMPYYVGTDLELRVNASDPDGNVARVDYYYDSYAEGTSQPIATSTVSPFTSTVTLPPAANHFQRILAVATDNSGAKTVSASVLFLITYYTPNDFFGNRKIITGERVFELGDNQYSTTEAGETGGGDKSIWWSWTAPVSGTFVISSRGWPAGFMPKVDVYTGSSLDALTLVGSGTANYLSTTYTAQVSLDATAGQTYAIRVATVLGLGGEAGLSILPLSPPGTPPQLEILPFSNNGKIEFMVLTNSAVSTELQRSPDLKTWTPFTSTTYPPNGYFKEIYPRPSESSYFYRIVEKAPPP